MDKRLVFLSASSQPDFAAVLLVPCIIILFVLGVIRWIKKERTVEEMEGIWYCRELKIQISLSDPNNAFLMKNGERIQCRCDACATKHNIGMLDMYCREWEHPRYKHGKTLFRADILSYSEMTMDIYDRKTRRKYTFVRTDKIG